MLQGNKPKAEKLWAILSAEYKTKLWLRLRRYVKGEIRTSLNRIEKPIYDETGEITSFQTITESSEMFSQILQRNIRHFAQESTTPFVEGPFGSQVHPFQFNHFSDSILTGKVDLSDFAFNEAILTCVKEMAYPQQENRTDTVSAAISLEDYKSGFCKASEKTSSAPSGQHLGHYRAALTSNSLSFVYSTVMSLTFEYGFTLERWTNALQVMLEKVVVTPRLDKLRVIQLIEADLNMVLRIVFGRRLIHRAEDRNTNLPLQRGSRPNRSSLDAITMKRLTYDGIRICKKVAIIFSNDGKAAFDRMISSVGVRIMHFSCALASWCQGCSVIGYSNV